MADRQCCFLMAHAQSTLLYAVDIPTLQTLRPLHRHKRCQKAPSKEKTWFLHYQRKEPHACCQTAHAIICREECRPSFCFENDLLLRFLTQKGPEFCIHCQREVEDLPICHNNTSHTTRPGRMVSFVASVGEDYHIVSTQAPTSLGMLFAKRLWKTCRKNLSFSVSMDRLPSAKSARTRKHLQPVLPNNWASANCIRPLKRWACLLSKRPSEITFKSSSQSSVHLEVVLHIMALPTEATPRSKNTPKGGAMQIKGLSFLTFFSKDPPQQFKQGCHRFFRAPNQLRSAERYEVIIEWCPKNTTSHNAQPP